MEREYLKQRLMLAGFGTLLLWVIGIFNILLNDNIKPVFSTAVTEQKEETDRSTQEDIVEVVEGQDAEREEYAQELYQLMLEEQSDDAIPLVYIGDAPMIRVLLRDSNFSGRLHDEVEITSDGPFSVNFTYKGQNTEVFYGAGEVVNVGKYEAWFMEGSVRINGYGGMLEIQSLEREYGNPVYEGILEIKKSGEQFYVINELSLEEYLRYVVPSEMPSGYPKEALKAQAICARTYAYQFIQNPGFPKIGANLDDSVSYQVYNNIPAQESTDIAIEETRGQLLAYNDELAEVFFYSTSCGFGTDISAWNANTAKYPYLQAKNHGEQKLMGVEALASSADSYIPTGAEMQVEEVFVKYINQVCTGDFEAGLPWYRWTYSVVELDEDVLEDRLKEKYETKPELILTQNANGNFESKKIDNLKKIKNIWVSSRRPGGAANGLCIQTEDALYQVLTENAIRFVLCDGSTKVVNSEGKKVSFNNLLPSAFFAISTSKEGENVVGYNVIGGGYGHGIGMSQNGASQMAKSGYSSAQILQHFFEGTQIKQVY